MHLDDALATILPALRSQWKRHLIVSGSATAVVDAVTKIANALSDEAVVGVTSCRPAPAAAAPTLLWAEHGPDRSSTQCLRAFLRQDPDCIVVHDVIDAEVLTLVVTAAQTGHQVIVATAQRIDDVTALEAEILAPFGVPPLLTWALLVGDDGATLRSRDVVDGVAGPWGLFAAPTIIDDASPTTLADGGDDATAFQAPDDDDDDDEDSDDDDDF